MRLQMPTNFADRQSHTDQEALDFHAGVKLGKLEIRASKPMATQKDLSLAYSPGVAAQRAPRNDRFGSWMAHRDDGRECPIRLKRQ
jgi:malic enzyme